MSCLYPSEAVGWGGWEGPEPRGHRFLQLYIGFVRKEPTGVVYMGHPTWDPEYSLYWHLDPDGKCMCIGIIYHTGIAIYRHIYIYIYTHISTYLSVRPSIHPSLGPQLVVRLQPMISLAESYIQKQPTWKPSRPIQ